MALIWPSLALSWPPWLRFNSLDLRESGLDPVSANFRPNNFSRPRKNRIWAFYPLKIASYGLGTIIERSASKFCISGLRRRVKRSSWSNFMAMSIRFILQWRSRLHLVITNQGTHLQRRVKQSSWSNFMAMSIHLIPMWRSTLLFGIA